MRKQWIPGSLFQPAPALEPGDEANSPIDGSPNFKHKVIRRDFFGIVMDIKRSLETIAAVLFEVELINQTTFDQTRSMNQTPFGKSCDLLAIILSKIEGEQKLFDVFLSVLRRVDLSGTADRLEEGLEKEESISPLFYPVKYSSPVGARKRSRNDSGYFSPIQPVSQLSYDDHDFNTERRRYKEHISKLESEKAKDAQEVEKNINQKSEEIARLETKCREKDKEVEDLKKNKAEMEQKIVDLERNSRKEIQSAQDSWKKKLQKLQENLEDVQKREKRALTDLADAKLALNEAKLALANANLENGREMSKLRKEHLQMELVMEEELADFKERELQAIRDKLVEEQNTMSRSLETENEPQYANSFS